MIPLNDTGDTVVMLLVAAGVGLLGGIGAAFLEIRRDRESAKEAPANKEAPASKGALATFLSSIVLGGIAAVAILYFFPPEETVSTTVNGMTEVVKEYNLTKLVALALIVGSAGASFLLVLQKRTMDLADAKEEAAKKTTEAAEATGAVMAVQVQAHQEVDGLSSQAPALARSRVAEGLEPMVRKAIEDASAEPGPVSAETVAAVVKEIGDQTETAVEDSIEPVVKGAQKRISAAASLADPSSPATDTAPEGA
jgi:hypothetical protein